MARTLSLRRCALPLFGLRLGVSPVRIPSGKRRSGVSQRQVTQLPRRSSADTEPMLTRAPVEVRRCRLVHVELDPLGHAESLRYTGNRWLVPAPPGRSALSPHGSILAMDGPITVMFESFAVTDQRRVELVLSSSYSSGMPSSSVSASSGSVRPARTASSWAANAIPASRAIPVTLAHNSSAITAVSGP